MKTYLYCTLLALAFSFNESRGQCGMISIIGEQSDWNEDVFMTRDLDNPEEFSILLYLTFNDDHDGNGSVEMKFRENASWENNWGSTQFPSGVAFPSGPNFIVPIGNYKVTFNCNTLIYNFESICGMISLIGEFNSWAGDHFMERDPVDLDIWSTNLSLNAESNQYGEPDIIEMKFRENANWAMNWGDDSFPSGIGVLNGANIWVPLTTSGITTDYYITFNCSTGEYNFTETSGPISIYGEFNDWDGDVALERDAANFNLYSGILTLTPDGDADGNWIIEVKFRENEDITINWGSAAFPAGTGIQDGANIPVPLDEVGMTTDYFVTFNYTTGAYNFQSTSGSISIIGAFNGWNGDVPLVRSTSNPDLWTLTRRWTDDSAIKFRENNDWSNNWGDDGWPSGTASLNGPNIPLMEGTYDVTFNTSTLVYNFTTNPDACGEIGLVGDFNEWGGDDTYPYDIFMVRDPDFPGYFTIDYFFPESTTLLFRLDADPTFTFVWGGNSLCQTGVQDVAENIPVPAGFYRITFDYNSKDYCLQNLGQSFEAPEVISMVTDGLLTEEEWVITTEANRIIDGTPTGDLNEVTFGAAYSTSHLYIGIRIIDELLCIGETVEIFLDGDHSGGAYDEHDLHFIYNPGNGVQVFQGPEEGITISAATNIATGELNMEFGIPLDPLGLTPSDGEQAGFDLFVMDDDTGGIIDYTLSWNGTLENLQSTAGFGNLVFGNMLCGCISMYNPTIGDVRMRPSSDQPEIYYATYKLYDDLPVLFRKDFSNDYFWGASSFPSGYAESGGPGIPAQEGKYRISFNCKTGYFNFSSDIPAESFANAYYIESQPVMDGQLEEYNLFYYSENLVSGTGPVNNVVNWGTAWDEENLYIGISVTDEALYGNGSPWDNDGIEFYIDGNNDKDGAYDPEFDSHIIMDMLNQSVPWFKADGVPIDNYSAAWVFTALGYNIELRLGWDNFDFEPGKGRTMGFSLGNNDNDNNVGRDYLTVWYGLEANWNNTSLLGNLELYNGPYYVDIEDLMLTDEMIVYPNPASGAISVLLTSEQAKGNFKVMVFDISGKQVLNEGSTYSAGENRIILELGDLKPGLYLLNVADGRGNNYVKKLVIR